MDNVPDTIDRWYKKAMCLDRQWRQARCKVEYYSKMMSTAHTTQPRNNAGQYDNKSAAPAAPAKDPNAMDIDRQHQ